MKSIEIRTFYLNMNQLDSILESLLGTGSSIKINRFKQKIDSFDKNILKNGKIHFYDLLLISLEDYHKMKIFSEKRDNDDNEEHQKEEPLYLQIHDGSKNRNNRQQNFKFEEIKTKSDVPALNIKKAQNKQSSIHQSSKSPQTTNNLSEKKWTYSTKLQYSNQYIDSSKSPIKRQDKKKLKPSVPKSSRTSHEHYSPHVSPFADTYFKPAEDFDKKYPIDTPGKIKSPNLNLSPKSKSKKKQKRSIPKFTRPKTLKEKYQDNPFEIYSPTQNAYQDEEDGPIYAP